MLTQKEKIIAPIALIILIITSIMYNASISSIITATCGVLYCFLIGKKMRSGYFFGIINVTLYGITLYTKGIIFGSIYNLFYGLPILIYGYYYWSNKKKDESINTFKQKQKIFFYTTYLLVIITAIITYIINKDIILALDILTACCGFIGMYLLANKYKEQWPVWIVSNLLNSILWIKLTMDSISNISVAIMWVLYLANSLYGLYNWRNVNK